MFFKGSIEVFIQVIGAGFVLLSLTYLNKKIVLSFIAPNLLVLCFVVVFIEYFIIS